MNRSSLTKRFPIKSRFNHQKQRQTFTSSAKQSKTLRQISPLNTRNNPFGNVSCRRQRDAGRQHHSSSPQSSSGHVETWPNKLDIWRKLKEQGGNETVHMYRQGMEKHGRSYLRQSSIIIISAAHMYRQGMDKHGRSELRQSSTCEERA